MTSTRSAIVAEARAWIGTPYQHQASLKGVGCDCLGLVRGVWRAVIGAEPERAPPYAPGWAEATGEEALAEAAARHLLAIERNDFREGDVLLFRWRAGMPAKHAAIVTSAQTMAQPIQVGDTFTVTTGCDKRFATCLNRFNNAVNFRGFPQIPGNDFVISYPVPGAGANDGSSMVGGGA